MTTTFDLKLSLPDHLAQEAQEAGLLTGESIAFLLREEIRKQRVERLFEAADRLAALEQPAMTADEIEVEIQAARSNS